MRTRRELYPKKPIVYSCELNVCPQCGGPLKVAYVSGAKTVQTLAGVPTIAHRPKYCADPCCGRYQVICKSAQWQQIAPSHCTYGYDVIALIGIFTPKVAPVGMGFPRNSGQREKKV